MISYNAVKKSKRLSDFEGLVTVSEQEEGTVFSDVEEEEQCKN